MSAGIKSGRPPRRAIGWGPALLVGLAVWAAAAGALEARWVEDDLVFLYACLGGALVGVGVAASGIEGRWALTLVSVSGLLAVGEGTAHWAQPLLDRQWAEARRRLTVLGARLADWLASLPFAQAAPNAAAFTFVVAVILWASAAWLTWTLLRGGELYLGALPLGGALALSVFFSDGRIGYLLMYAAAVVLAAPVVHLRRLEWQWLAESVDFSPEVRADVWQAALVIALAVVLLAAITPIVSVPRTARALWDWISRPQELVQEVLLRFFGGVRPASPPEVPGGGPTSGPALPETGLPRSHLLGGHPDLARWPVMSVCTDAPPSMPDDRDPLAPAGFQTYWRGITYDTFSGRRWSNQVSFKGQARAYEPVSAPAITHTRSLRQHYVVVEQRGRVVYAVGEPHTVDQAVRVLSRGDGDLIGLEGLLGDYVVESRVPWAPASALDQAPADYPSQILERYLQAPAELPERVRLLAAEIVAGAVTPYERAATIERYLRQFPYDLRVPSPPADRDVVDYFLFDAQRGYCDYYASSFVILARLSGLPARLAVGYGMGEYDPDLGCYRVTEMDAHSWPEVYFPQVGWVPFEPTAAFHPFGRAADTAQPAPFPDRAPSIPRRSWTVALREWGRRSWPIWGAYAAWTAGAAGAAVAGWQIALWRRRRRLSPRQLTALCYEGMTRAGRRLGVSRRPSDSPAEYGAALLSALGRRSGRWSGATRRLSAVVGAISRQVSSLVLSYERASYAGQPVDPEQSARTARGWRELRALLWWVWLFSRPGGRASKRS